MGGRYQVDRLIGRGGMGLVYLGRELLDDRELVLKMLAPHWAHEPTAVARFEREGKRLSELRHPNIVELFDIGHQDDHPYIVMEFIRGIPLRKVLKKKGRLSPAEFYPIAAQMLEAVAYAHDKGIMLRDIKPSNVMLCEQDGKANVVKVLDFGLAKMVEGDDVEVTKSNVIGTAGFLAPELIRGGDVDVRVDVYALGIMFFMMLTGSSPIVGENDGAILYNHVHGTPKAFEDALPEGVSMPQAVQDFVYGALTKDAAERPASAGKLLETLKKMCSEEELALPLASDTGHDEIERYWERKKQGVGLSADNPSSSLWTRPRLEKLLEGGAEEAEAVKASNHDPYGTSPSIELMLPDLEMEEALEEDPDDGDGADEAAADAKPEPEPEAKPKPKAKPKGSDEPNLVLSDPGARNMPPQPSAAIRAKTAGRLPAAPTRLGQPAVGTESSSEPPVPLPSARRPKPARTVASSNMNRALPGPPPRRHTVPATSESVDPPTLVQPPKSTLPPTDAGPVAMPGPMKGSSVTLVPTPVQAPSPFDGGGEVGPLHLELQSAPKRRPRPSGSGSRPTLPMGPMAADVHADLPEVAAVELDDLDIDVDMDVDVEVDVDPDPITDPVSPATATIAAAAVAPVMHSAEPVPTRTKGIGTILAISVGAALVVGGIVTWLALRPSDDGDVVAEATEKEAVEPATPGGAKPTTPGDVEAAPAVGIDDDADIDPDAPGTIRVEGPVGGEAFVNDESVGTVPAKVSRPPGLYTIRVEARGFEDWSADVQLQADGRAKLVAANTIKLGGSRSKKNRRKGASKGGSKPSAAPPKTTTPDPEPATKPDPAPKTTPPPAEDDVFMKRGEKKDDGIFLPVGK